MDVLMMPARPGTRFTYTQVVHSDLFHNWSERVGRVADIVAVRVYAAYGWPDANGMTHVRMLHMGVVEKGKASEQAVFLRGSAVDMLVVLTDGQNRYVVHVDQLRIPAGQVVRSNPAGMVDPGEAPQVTALRELTEELGVEIVWGAIECLNRHMFDGGRPMLGSPGGSDEDVMCYVATATVSPAGLKALHGKLTGLAHEDERLTLRLTPLGTGREGVIRAIESLAQGGRRPDLKAALTLLAFYVYLDHDN